MSQRRPPSKRAAVAVQLLGRAGTRLLPLMEDGAAGIELLQQQARDLGLTVSTDAAKGSAALADALNILWKQVKRSAFGIGAALAPAILKAATWISDAAARAIRWIDANKGLVISIAKITLREEPSPRCLTLTITVDPADLIPELGKPAPTIRDAPVSMQAVAAIGRGARFVPTRTAASIGGERAPEDSAEETQP